MKKFYKPFLLIAGWICVGLGIIGAILPLMPSTVFFILAAIAFSKSSERFYHRVLNDQFVGNHVRNFLEKRGMPIRAKYISIFMLFFTITTSIFFTTRNPFAIAMLLSIAFGVAGYIISLNTIRKKSFQKE
jgi:uncharacterized membrane protein YbaN (DUF454 family)